MPVVRKHHLERARFERAMAAASATTMARIIHSKLADLHGEAADARPTTPGPLPTGGDTAS